MELRAGLEPLLHTLFRSLPYPQEIQETKFEIESLDGARIGVSRFATSEQVASPGEGEPLRPAVLNIHGGGMVSCSVEIFAPAIARSATRAGVQMFAVDYRLAPEHPAPAAVGDCYAALRWLSAHAAELHIDAARIALLGDSAGGGIAAGTALMARDRGLDPPLAKQVLIYPMLDDRTAYPPDWPGWEFVTWNRADNDLGWNAYVGADKRGRRTGDDVSIYAAPARAEDLAGLPSTYIDVGSLDLFRDECLDFATRLAKANVEVEFHLYPGVPHGFESATEISWTKRALENRFTALRMF